jgi:hypothetical protein
MPVMFEIIPEPPVAAHPALFCPLLYAPPPPPLYAYVAENEPGIPLHAYVLMSESAIYIFVCI